MPAVRVVVDLAVPVGRLPQCAGQVGEPGTVAGGLAFPGRERGAPQSVQVATERAELAGAVRTSPSRDPAPLTSSAAAASRSAT